MLDDEVLAELKILQEKMDQILGLLRSPQSVGSKPVSRKPKSKLAPLSSDEIQKHQCRFIGLY